MEALASRPPRPTSFGPHVLAIDPAREAARIQGAIADQVQRELRRRGVVLGLSGGIDSSVCAALCARALGPDRVLGLLMPERDSASESTSLGRALAGALGIRAEYVPIAPALQAFGCYLEQEAAARSVFPEYGEGWRCKVVLPPLSAESSERLNVFFLVVESPDGRVAKKRMPADALRRLVAATNMKQRTRKQVEYHRADLYGFAVVGTPNRLEYDQGFFVKNGDGAADLKPIAHLYKSQVYALAEHLGIPEEIRVRPPTTDTYSMTQTQEEFYFPLPWDKMDLCLYGKNHDVPAADVARAVGIGPAHVDAIYRDIDQKRRTTRYLHLSPLLSGRVAEIEA